MIKKATLNELRHMLSRVLDRMATKDDIAGIMSELTDVKQRLTRLEETVADHAGHSKEIDHAFERIAAIEKRLGIKAR
ncbi:hypothetical protein HY418_03025 [Candidatus Kaiserbacteria bacterium]|nr:hypothetical protein [Candidatus Kaiserbacteria bacterium]